MTQVLDVDLVKDHTCSFSCYSPFTTNHILAYHSAIHDAQFNTFECALSVSMRYENQLTGSKLAVI